LAENRLFLSTDNYGLAWLLRPGVLVILALTILGASYPFFKARILKRKKRKAEPAAPQVVSGKKIELGFSGAAVFSLLIVVVFILALWQTRSFDIRAGLFPWAIGFPVLGLAIMQCIKDFLGLERKKGGPSTEDAGTEVPADLANRRTAGICGWIIGYFVAIWLLGFSLGGPLCTFIQLKIASREKWLISIILTASAWAMIYGAFDRILHVPFPAGELLVWLKLAT
jgi:hypothetical protein